MSKNLKFLLKIAVSLACAYYAFSGIDFARLWATMKHYSPVLMTGVFFISFFSYAILGLRLSRLRQAPLPVFSCVEASLLCLGLNNILPAKAGEIAKIEWLSRHHNMTVAAATGIVFWERFFDVNFLLLLGLWAAWVLDIDAGLWGGCVVLIFAWSSLLLAKKFPRLFPKIFAKIRAEKLTAFLISLQNEALANMNIKQISWLAFSTSLVWGTYFLSAIMAYVMVAGLDVNITQGICIFAISSLGMLLPSTPGAIGVYEASTVLALSWFGIDKERALGIALFSHALQFVPTTILGGIVFIRDAKKSA